MKKNYSFHPKLFQRWCAATKELRREQWNKIANQSFDIFEMVRQGTADGLVFFPYKEIFTKNQIILVEAHWSKLTGTKAPDRLVYIIYDQNADIPYTGSVHKQCVIY